MAGEGLPLRLRSGVVVEDPLGDALRFIADDGTYASYDSVAVDPFDLSEADVRVAKRIIARMGAGAATALLSRREEVRDALAQVPVDASLAGPTDTVPWDALHALYRSLEGLAHVGLPRATKVLHKKRPALIPILDEVVISYLDRVDDNPGATFAERGSALTRSYHRELQAGLPVLVAVHHELGERGYRLSECRLLDIYLWAYSGTYEPLWQRRASTSPASTAPRPAARPAGFDDPPVTTAWFSHDDPGFRRWCAEHPDGYLLNCAHHPSPSYLKLHRVSCPHLNRASVTSWTEAYAKLCAPSASLLDELAMARLRAQPDHCPTCCP